MQTLSLTCIGTNVHHTLAMLLGVQLHLYFSKWLSLTRLQMNYSTKRASSKSPQGNSATDINQTTKLPPPSPSSRHTHTYVRARACTHVHPWAHILTQTHTGAKKRVYARAHTHTHAHTGMVSGPTFLLLMASSRRHCHSKDCSQMPCQRRSKFKATSGSDWLSLLLVHDDRSTRSTRSLSCSTADTIREWDSMSCWRTCNTIRRRRLSSRCRWRGRHQG